MATIIDDDRHHEIAATGDRITLTAEELESVTGWMLKPEGLCRGDVCVPVRDRSGLVVDDRVDLAGFAQALGRPVVVDPQRGVAALGRPAPAVAEEMASLRAPDFSLPDLDGTLVSLSEFARRKVLLLAWSSW
jgi:hypothetical protein